MPKRRIEIFSAGCTVCEEAVAAVRKAACPSCDVQVRPMSDARAAADAARYGIKSLPSVVIDGVLASCCGRSIDFDVLRDLGLGAGASAAGR